MTTKKKLTSEIITLFEGTTFSDHQDVINFLTTAIDTAYSEGFKYANKIAYKKDEITYTSGFENETEKTIRAIIELLKVKDDKVLIPMIKNEIEELRKHYAIQVGKMFTEVVTIGAKTDELIVKTEYLLKTITDIINLSNTKNLEKLALIKSEIKIFSEKT